MRRLILKSAVVSALALLVGAPALAAGEVKVVYHLSEGLDQASRTLGNIRNHLDADPSAKIVVVGHGDGILFMIEGAKNRNGQAYDAPVGALASRGVEFRVCNNTLTARSIPANKVLLDAKVVQSGVAEVARLQAKEGYAYLHP